MEYKVKTLTKDGATMFAQADAQKQPVVVDKMVISDNKVDPNSDLTGLTIDDFTNNHEFDASNTTQNDTSFTVVSVMTNKGFTADYDVNLIGLLAHIGTDTANEKIIAIATGDDPFTLPQDTGTPVQLVPAFTTGFGTATNVTVTVSDEAYVLKSDLDNIFKVNLGSYTPTSELTDYISSNLPADVAKTDAANTFTKQQTFSAGAVNGNGKKALFDGDVDLSGTQPKGDYATNPDLTTKLAKKWDISAGTISNGANLDSMLTDGVFAFNDNDPKTLNSFPTNLINVSPIWGKLIVISADSELTRQLIFVGNGEFVYRTSSGSPRAWNDWSQLPTTADVETELANKVTDNHDGTQQLNGVKIKPFNENATELADGTDVNTLFDEGLYSMNGVSIKNAPNGNTQANWNGLVVFHIGRSNVPFQMMWGTISTNDLYFRIAAGIPLNWNNWVQVASSDDVQSAINQAHTDMTSELTKRGYPSAIWTGTQAQYDAMKSHDAHTEYRITG